MKTRQNAIRNFRADLARLRALEGWKSNQKVAEFLGCDEATVRNMVSDPMKTTGAYILLIEERLREIDREMYPV